MRTTDEVRLEIIGLFLERKKNGLDKYQTKANSVLQQYAQQVDRENMEKAFQAGKDFARQVNIRKIVSDTLFPNFNEWYDKQQFNQEGER